MGRHIGKQTVLLENPPSIIAASSTVGPKEAQGPLGDYFDVKTDDELWGENTWEKAESKFVKETIKNAIKNAKLTPQDIQYIFAGDLLNQITGSTFGIRDFNIPFYGLFGACSTMAESMSLGSMIIDGGFADYVIAATSSHFAGAEKQFRFPMELGTQRALTAQWTVTGSGAVVLAKEGNGPYVTSITTGRVVDLGITDTFNMGAAMAPAAADTIIQHLKDTSKMPDYYDLIITGDLGTYGRELLIQLARKDGYELENILTDCGIEIFDPDSQDTHAGGSGCGCSASVLTGFLYKEIKKGRWNKVLFVPTGALHSPSSTQQGETIPGIAHAVAIEKSLRKDV